jgi:hypothetical protein
MPDSREKAAEEIRDVLRWAGVLFPDRATSRILDITDRFYREEAANALGD